MSSDPTPTGAPDRFVISPRPAIRAYAVAALLALIGAVVLILGRDLGGGTPALVVAVVLILAAVALSVLALLAGRRGRVLVELDSQGYTVRAADQPDASGRWSDVTRVTGTSDRITLHRGEDARTHLVAPPGSNADLDALAQAISRHLDADRGYQQFAG